MVLVRKLLTEAPQSPVDLNSEVPPALAALVLRLLAKNPGERVQTARELEQPLESLFLQESYPTNVRTSAPST